MSVLTIASSKGGPGKTTLCQVLAGSLAGECRLVVLDADPTQALSRWAKATYEGPAFEAIAEPDETQLAHLISLKAETADLVLVDTAGFGNRAATVAMTSADAVLVPTLAGEADITEAEKTARLVDGLAEPRGAYFQPVSSSTASGGPPLPATLRPRRSARSSSGLPPASLTSLPSGRCPIPAACQSPGPLASRWRRAAGRVAQARLDPYIVT